MKYNQEYVYALLLRKQLGELTDVEDKLLEKVFQHDYHCWRAYNEMQELAEQLEKQDSSERLFPEDLIIETQWLKVKELLAKRSLKDSLMDIFHLRPFRLYPQWIIRAIDRKVKIIKQTDPDKIFADKIKLFFHIPITLARLFCEMAVQGGLFRRKVVIVCPKCIRIVAVYSDKSEIPDQIICKGCNGTQDLSVIHADQNHRIIFYQLIRHEVITA